ncbi:MAG: phosphatase PAP2 family protein [Flavobacteriales bacterium]|nr:phosphatase PAP2 family protein [Flavobacteriales bacterium]
MLNGLHAPWADEVMRVVSDRFIWIPLYLLLLIVLQRRFGWRGLAWAVPSIALLIFMADKGSVLLFKETVQRLRPCFEPLLEGRSTWYASCGGKYGFVSSHASNHFAIAVFMSMALRSTPRWATAALLLWAALIAYSRVYLGVHYPVMFWSVAFGVHWSVSSWAVSMWDSLLQGNTHECLVSDLHRRWRWQCAALRGLPCSVAGAISPFPWATLASNLLATALLAWLIMRFNVLHPGKGTWQALLAIGLCGGFSTMSTFSYENYLLIRNGLFGFAMINVLLTVTLGIMLFYFFARTP